MSHNARREERSAQRWRESVADECFEEGSDDDEDDLDSDDTLDDEDPEDDEGEA